METATKAFFAAFACALAVSLASCDASGIFWTHELLVSPPVRPEVWRDIPSVEYILSWKDSEGRIEATRLKEGETVRIYLPRGKFQCLRLDCFARFSVAGKEFRLRPAGILYPFESARSGDSVVASWLQGYVCEVGEALGRGGYDPSAFNLSRLETLLEDMGCDPWHNSCAQTAKDLAQGRFRREDFTPPALFPVTLPPPGAWIPESPLGMPVVESRTANTLDPGRIQEIAPGTSCSSTELPAGIHVFLRSGGKLVVDVDEDGNALWVRSGEL